LPSLVELGIVERREVPPAAQFRYVHEHVAAQAVSALAAAHRTVLHELCESAGCLAPAATSVLVFGSFARGEADASSDLDVVVIRPADIDEEEPQWRLSLDHWQAGVRRLTGNRVELVEIAEPDAARLVRSRRPFWLELRRDGVVLAGKSLDELRGRAGA